jgi:uncharacterized membrane protein (UPF0127 family)
MKIPALVANAVFFLGLGFGFQLPACSGSLEPAFYQVRAGSRVFTVRAAVSPAEKQLGLMYTENLQRDNGLLLIFKREQRVPIWMKNMLIPIDVAWIASSGEVVDKKSLPICRNDPCQTYIPKMPANYVLEVAVGSFPLNIGDRVEILKVSSDSLLPPESGIITPREKF